MYIHTCIHGSVVTNFDEARFMVTAFWLGIIMG